MNEETKMAFIKTIENGYMVECPKTSKVWMYGHLTIAMSKVNELMLGVDIAAKEEQTELALADTPAE